MHATFSPIAGISFQFYYDRQELTAAIAAQVSAWMSGIAFSFFGLCENAIAQGGQARVRVNQKALKACEKFTERISETADQAQELVAALVIATGCRVRRKVVGLVLPSFQELTGWWQKQRHQVSEVLDAYLAGAEEPMILGAVREEAVMLSADVAADVVSEAAVQLAAMDDGAGAIRASATDRSIAESPVEPSVEIVELQSQAVTGDQDVEKVAAIELGSPKARKRGTVTA